MDLSRMQTALAVLTERFRSFGFRFERVRCWTPERVMVGLIMLVSRPGVTSIEKLMPALVAAFQLPVSPSDSTFIEARAKFAKRFPTGMRDLWQRMVAHAVAAVPEHLRVLHGRQWVAVDGTWAWAPHEAGAIQRWGRPKAGGNSKLHFPQMLMVTALDVLTKVPLAAALLPHDGSERAGLRSFLDLFKPGMVVMADRGFPAQDLLARLVGQGADLLWRVGTAEVNAWACVTRFLKDRAKPVEQIVELPLGLPDATGRPTAIRVRLIRRVFPRGRPKTGQSRDKMVLMTTLLDDKVWPAKNLIAMYERRWVIETWFRDVKVHFGMEAFHSRSDQLIEQEIHALMAWLTVCAIVERNVYARIERSRGPQRLDDPRWFQISPTNPYNAAARIFTRLLVTQDIATALAESEVDLR
jgi:hypothetical protein